MRTILLMMAAAAAGCVSCTQMGCFGTIEVVFDEPAAAGGYAVDVELGDLVTTCSFTVGETADTGGFQSDCDVVVADGAVSLRVMTGMGEPPERVTIALPRARPRFLRRLTPAGALNTPGMLPSTATASIVPALYSRKIPKAEDERLGRNGRLFLQHARVLLGASTDGGHVRRIRREVLLIALLT